MVRRLRMTAADAAEQRPSKNVYFFRQRTTQQLSEKVEKNSKNISAESQQTEKDEKHKGKVIRKRTKRVTKKED